MESKVLAATVARIADEKKGIDVVVYDVCEAIQVVDYFVVVTGTSRPHVKALYQEIHHRLKAAGQRHARAEGADVCWWVLVDFGDVVVHLQQAEAREYYGLDDLYGDCERLDWESVDVPDLPARRA